MYEREKMITAARTHNAGAVRSIGHNFLLFIHLIRIEYWCLKLAVFGSRMSDIRAHRDSSALDFREHLCVPLLFREEWKFFVNHGESLNFLSLFAVVCYSRMLRTRSCLSFPFSDPPAKAAPSGSFSLITILIERILMNYFDVEIHSSPRYFHKLDLRLVQPVTHILIGFFVFDLFPLYPCACSHVEMKISNFLIFILSKKYSVFTRVCSSS